MIPEVQVLALAGLLQCLQFVLMAVPANLELGPRRTMGPRDGRPLIDDVSPGTARLHRALSNHFEGLILFTVAVTALVLGDKTTALSTILAWTYLGARILYVPAYWLGLSPWRSIVWVVGWLATVLMLLLALV